MLGWAGRGVEVCTGLRMLVLVGLHKSAHAWVDGEGVRCKGERERVAQVGAGVGSLGIGVSDKT